MIKRRTNLVGVQTIKRLHADGSVAVHYYHRATKTKLPGKPGSGEFKAAYDAAQAKSDIGIPISAKSGTLAGLILAYCKSAEWRALAKSSRDIGRLNLKAVEAKWGTLPVRVFAGKAIRAKVLEWRDELALTHVRAADAKVSSFARVLSWALDRGLVEDNPLLGVKRVYQNDRADRIWLPDHVAAFEAKASPELRLALMLALHTGQRQGDIRALRWDQFDGKAITLEQGKRAKGKRRHSLWIPCTASLRAVLTTATRRGETIVTNTRGDLWEKRAFSRAWERVYKAAKLPKGEDALHFHDLRGTAVTMLSEAGCTTQEIATITGHSLSNVTRILEVYLSRTRALASSAIAKLDNHERNVETTPDENRL